MTSRLSAATSPMVSPRSTPHQQSPGGCQGNKNRFMTKEACDNSCGHEAQLKEATRICKQVI